jgi:hypothetical protein
MPPFKLNRFRLPERVEGEQNTFTLDDKRVDHASWLNPQTGLLEQRSIKATEEELRAREVASLRRALESVDARIAQLDPNDVFAWEEPRTEEQMRRRREGLDAERAHILAELARLEAEPPTKKGKRR